MSTENLDIALDALRLIAGDRCERLTGGGWRCIGDSEYTRGARYSGDAWCDACVAYDAMQRIAEGRGEAPVPSWQEVLTEQRDEARDELASMRAAYRHVENAWTTMQNAARHVIAADLPAEGSR